MLQRAYNIFFETLGNKNRLIILESLMEKPMTVNQLTKNLNMEQTTISHNLKRLFVTGFVNFKKQGKTRIYESKKDVVKPLLKLVNYHLKCNCNELCRCKENEFIKKLRR